MCTSELKGLAKESTTGYPIKIQITIYPLSTDFNRVPVGSYNKA